MVDSFGNIFPCTTCHQRMPYPGIHVPLIKGLHVQTTHDIHLFASYHHYIRWNFEYHDAPGLYPSRLTWIVRPQRGKSVRVHDVLSTLCGLIALKHGLAVWIVFPHWWALSTFLLGNGVPKSHATSGKSPRNVRVIENSQAVSDPLVLVHDITQLGWVLPGMWVHYASILGSTSLLWCVICM